MGAGFLRAIGVVSLLFGGCAPAAFGCEDDGQCASANSDGQCELNGYCSFPDGECGSGRRYGDAAGGGLSGLCVNAEPDPTTGTGTDGTTTTGTPATTSGLTTMLPTSTSSATNSTSATGLPTTTTTSTTSTTTTTSGPDDSSSTASSGEETATGTTGGSSLDEGLLIHYTFDADPSVGLGAVSESMTGLDATCVAANCPTATRGPVGMAARFDGVDDRLIVADDPRLRFEDGFSLATWVQLESPPVQAFAFLLGKAWGESSSNSYEFYYSVGNAVYFGTDTTDASAASVSLNGDFPKGWLHFAGTWDGAVWTMYVNGGLQGATALTTAPAYDETPFSIGADYDSGMVQYFFPGSFDEVRVYDRALTAAEVAELAAEAD